MSDADLRQAPAAMEGHGFYNRSSSVQAAGTSPAVPLFEEAARRVPLPPVATPIVIADYGSSEGRNSLAPLAAALHTLRQRVGPEWPISVVHTDLPSNDFATLFRVLTDDPQSYLRNDAAVFAAAVGRSFYEPLLPPRSVTLGWSAWAVQWLSRAPGPLGDQLQMAYSHNAAARAAYTRQSAEDWRAFLTQRGRELRTGGRLVVVTMALHEDGNFGYAAVLEAMYGALLDLVGTGLLREEEARRMAIPTVGRSRADLMLPFSQSGRCAGLSVQYLVVFDAQDQIWSTYVQEQDAAAFGARWAAFSRASVFPSLGLGLDGGRDDPRGASFVASLEAGMAARLAAKPEQMVIPLACMVLANTEP